VSIKELIEQQGRWYIVMELVEGQDLLAFVQCSSDPRGFDEGRLRMAFSGMARGIEALHGHGILHRDLKPSNVRVTPEGRAVLLDFGLATKVDPAGQSTHLGPVGTVRYMAPEQITGGDLGRASDWYAFGTCLYEALIGRPPYDDANAMAVAFRKTHYEALDLSALAPHLPEDLTKLSTALVRIAPELRPSGAQVRNTLNGSQSTPPHSLQLGSLSGTSERLLGSPHTFWRRSRRSRGPRNRRWRMLRRQADALQRSTTLVCTPRRIGKVYSRAQLRVRANAAQHYHSFAIRAGRSQSELCS
jgi:serine/threonine protein kinase